MQETHQCDCKKNMSSVDQEKQMIANWAQLVEDNIKIVVNANHYDPCKEQRLLIPFLKGEKMGLVNQMGEIVLNAEYDCILDDCYHETDLLRVGKVYAIGFGSPNGKVSTYIHHKYGLINAKGTFILDTDYRWIYVSDNKQLLTVRDLELRWGVVDQRGNTIVAFGTFDLIGGFSKGFARVKKGDYWGVINTQGVEVVPTIHKSIWDFYKKDVSSIIVDGEEVYFEELV